MADLKTDLGRTEGSKDAVLAIVLEGMRWGWRNRGEWETDFCCEHMDCHFDQFLKYLVDLQDDLPPGSTSQRMKDISELVERTGIPFKGASE